MFAKIQKWGSLVEITLEKCIVSNWPHRNNKYRICIISTDEDHCIISTDEDPSLRIESSAIINLRGVSTKLNKYNIESVVSHLSCLHFLLSIPFEICHMGFALCAMSSWLHETVNWYTD